MKEDGAAPRFQIMKRWHWRAVPKNWHCQGMGVVIRTFKHRLMLAALPVSTLRDETFSLAQLPKFLSKQEGVDKFKQEGIMGIVPPSSAVWVPYGMLSWPILSDECGLGVEVLIMPVFSAKLVKELKADTWGAVLKYLNTHFNKEKDTDQWREHRAVWEKFAKACPTSICVQPDNSAAKS